MVLKKSTKEVIRSRKSRDRQYNGIKEKDQRGNQKRKSRDRQYYGIKEKVPKR
jgi:hypothetical protein